MSSVIQSNLASWLGAYQVGDSNVYSTTFAEHHLGNIWIRSLHGGVTGSFIELSAEAETRKHLDADVPLMISSSSIDYLRITKDADLYVRAIIQRISRRLSVVDVTGWQDDESVLVARGIVTLKIG